MVRMTFKYSDPSLDGLVNDVSDQEQKDSIASCNEHSCEEAKAH